MAHRGELCDHPELRAATVGAAALQVPHGDHAVAAGRGEQPADEREREDGAPLCRDVLEAAAARGGPDADRGVGRAAHDEVALGGRRDGDAVHGARVAAQRVQQPRRLHHASGDGNARGGVAGGRVAAPQPHQPILAAARRHVGGGAAAGRDDGARAAANGGEGEGGGPRAVRVRGGARAAGARRGVKEGQLAVARRAATAEYKKAGLRRGRGGGEREHVWGQWRGLGRRCLGTASATAQGKEGQEEGGKSPDDARLGGPADGADGRGVLARLRRLELAGAAGPHAERACASVGAEGGG